MNRTTIKTLHRDISTNELSVRPINVEIYEYEGLKFGIYWGRDYNDTYIDAIELQTGLSVGRFFRRGSKAPKQDLLNRIAHFVNLPNRDSIILSCKQSIEKQKQKYDDEILLLQQKRDSLTFPVNKIE